MIPSPHNLHNYDEPRRRQLHRPYLAARTWLDRPPLFEIRNIADGGTGVLLHGDETGDRISGIVGGYLVWTGMVPSGPQATSLTEQLLHRQMGPVGNEMVGVALAMPPAAD